MFSSSEIFFSRWEFFFNELIWLIMWSVEWGNMKSSVSHSNFIFFQYSWNYSENAFSISKKIHWSIVCIILCRNLCLKLKPSDIMNTSLKERERCNQSNYIRQKKKLQSVSSSTVHVFLCVYILLPFSIVIINNFLLSSHQRFQLIGLCATVIAFWTYPSFL